MALGKICPSSRRICSSTSCRRRCRLRSTPQRELNQSVYRTAAHKKQRLRVFARDGWRCVDCGHYDESESGVGLVADHINGIDVAREFNDAELATRCLICSGKKDGGRAQRRQA